MVAHAIPDPAAASPRLYSPDKARDTTVRNEGIVTSKPTRPVKIAVAGGGTGGHVLPAIAVIDELRRRDAIGDLLWIGSETGVEREVARDADIPFTAIPTGKLRRYFSLQTGVDAARVPLGIIQARRLLRRFRPDAVFSTGGFVSVPAVLAARGVAPVLTHEQTAILGLANRINARFAAILALSYAETEAAAHGRSPRVEVTGNPVRAALRAGDRARGFARWGFDPNLPLVYVTGGARGASPINQRVESLLPELLDRCQILHQTGPASANDDLARLTAARETWPAPHYDRYQPVEYVRDELPDVYAAASLVVGRAGAGTVAELAFVGLPSVLIPLPGAGGDEQTRNARVLAGRGAAVLLPQADATPDRLRAVLLDLLDHPDRLTGMAAAARSVGRSDAAERLADLLLEVAHR
jgi:UDP-N-acetylglucosamine--N-acetylmuramyl-(pentapeptide) pyrophosphoryl-undecaprenol N-acetylglucosamine transferase